MMKVTLAKNRVFNDIIKMKIVGDKVTFWYWSENPENQVPLKMVTQKEVIVSLDYEFTEDE
jgi:hypothetical protein